MARQGYHGATVDHHEPLAHRLPHQTHHVSAIPVAQVDPRSTNPRSKLVDIDSLAESIRAYGLLQPVLVQRVGDRYVLVAGHRRFAAVKSLDWETIPAIVHESTTDEDASLLTLIENLQREDLTPQDEADALGELVRQRGWSTHQVADAIKRSQAYVSKRLRVFEDSLLRPAVLEKRIAVSTAEELLAVGPERRRELLERAINEKWERPQVRAAVRGELEHGDGRRRPAGFTRRVQELRTALRDMHPDDFTEADRRELRRLFQELGLVARAVPRPRPVIPPLPAS